jgi:hypothetical protein
MVEINKKERLVNLKGIAVRTVASYLCDQEIATLLQN